jgi:uncharacterized protein (DUF58 family)
VNVRMSSSPKLVGYLWLAGLGLLGAILFGRPAAAEIGICFFVAVIAGLIGMVRPKLLLSVRLDRERVLEGEEVSADLEIDAQSAMPWLKVLVPLPAGLQASSGTELQTIQLPAGTQRHLAIKLISSRWGTFKIGRLLVESHDRLGFFTFEQLLDQTLVLRVYPREEALARAIRPLETQVFSGNEVSRRIGDGIEFADVRTFVPGDRVRRINWPQSTRRGELHVNDVHPERNTDVVIFLDTFSELGVDGDSILLMTVRAAASLARHYLNRRDRVGLVSFGGTLRWLHPRMGVTQAYRFVDALLSTESQFSYAWKGIDIIPTRTLPPKALVIAITPLLDERTAAALFDLRGRGFDVAIVEVSPAPFLPVPSGRQDRLAYKLWALKREALRYEYRKAGIPISTWHRGESLTGALEEVRTFRRFARTSHV